MTRAVNEQGAPNVKALALSGFMWMSMGNSARAVLRIAVLAILARLLVPNDFGLVAAAGVVVWLSTLFANLGVGAALIQRPHLEPRHVATGFATSVSLGAVLGAVVYLLSPAIAALFRMPDLSPVLRVLALTFPIAGLSVVAEALLQRDMRFASLARAELISYAIGYGGIGVSLALLGAGVWALVAAEVSKSVIKSALFLLAVPDAWTMRFDRQAFRELLHFGARYTAGGLSVYFAMQGDTFIVARALGAGALGVYSRAYEIMLVPAQALGVILDKVLFPAVSKLQQDVSRVRLAYRRGTALTALCVLPASAVTMVLAPEIIGTLLGAGWEAAILPLRILAVGMYFRVGYMVGQAVANATGAVGGTAWRSALHAALIILGATIGQRWGISGVAAGVVVAVAVNFVLVFHLAQRITQLSVGEFVGVHAPALAITAVLAAGAWLITATLRSAGSPAAWIVLAVLLTALPLGIFLLRSVPRIVLGKEGIWLAETLCGSAPRPLRAFLRKALAVGGGV